MTKTYELPISPRALAVHQDSAFLIDTARRGNRSVLEVAPTGETSERRVRGLPVALIGGRDGVWTVEQQPNRLRLLC